MTEKIDLYESVIEMTRQNAKIGDSPMLFFKLDEKEKDKDGKQGIGIAVLQVPKNAMKLAIYNLVKLHDLKEIVLQTEAFYLIDEKAGNAKKGEKLNRKEAMRLEMPIRENPKRKETFVISYFSPEISYVYMLPFHRITKRNKEILKWEETDNDYYKVKESQSVFNPFTYTEKDIEEIKMEAEYEVIEENGSKQNFPLEFGHSFEILSYKGKAFFRAKSNQHGNYMRSKVFDDNEKFREDVEKAIKTIKLVGEAIGNGN